MSEFEWCMQLVSDKVLGLASKGATLLAARWDVDSEITLSFLDGDPTLQGRVRSAAQQWLTRTGARLSFRWVEAAAGALTDIRISFRYPGSWSMLGKECRSNKNRESPTMNFGWLVPASTDTAVQGVVLHEFGHALGLIHEHMSPMFNIPWDKDAVVAELSGPPNNWDRATIEWNMFKVYDAMDLSATQFDLSSVMLYPIKRSWTMGGVLETHPNNDLSALDIKTIADIYA